MVMINPSITGKQTAFFAPLTSVQAPDMWAPIDRFRDDIKNPLNKLFERYYN